MDLESKTSVSDIGQLPADSPGKKERSVILLDRNLNYCLDIQELLSELRERCTSHSRVAVILYNPRFSSLHRVLAKNRKERVPEVFLNAAELANLAEISDFELVRKRAVAHFPLKLCGLGPILDRLIAILPIINRFSLFEVAILRPIEEETLPSLSIVIPARDERDNIESALKRMPDFGGAKTEIIFVGGHSSDGTWEEIQRVAESYSDRFLIKTFRQDGVGKANAVRIGFEKAENELLTILDADLTMPPELLPRFYEAYCQGKGDFVNGNRLLYPIEGNGMRFLNRIGNNFFARSLSYLLDTRIGDSLCGTKLFTRTDYERMCEWRKDFGDLDPFGDFELLFPAAVFGLGIIDVPIRYRDRTYGSTSIHRFRHGFMLLKMSWAALTRIKA